MVIGILADAALKAEFLAKGVPPGTELVWADSLQSLGIIDADLYIDLLFEYDIERTNRLRKLLPRPVIVNSVVHTLARIGLPFIRINAWPTMLGRPVTEVAVRGEEERTAITQICSALNWPCQIVPDTVGMTSPLLAATLINEAWRMFPPAAGQADVDALMQGMGMLRGPFAWGDQIGLQRVTELLEALAPTDSRYAIAPALIAVR